MSRFLKVIVNLVLVCALLSAAALLVPPLAGVDMNIIKSDRVETNLPVGSVVYGKTKPLADVAVGDEVFVLESDGSEYLYSVNGVEADTGTVVLQDARNANAEAAEKAADSLSVVIVTVPVLGYLAVAAGSVKGWIIIGLCALLLLLLYVISEIWRKDKLREEIEDDEDGTLEEEEMTRAEGKRQKKEKKAARKAAKKAARLEAEEDDDEDDEYETYLKKKEEKRASKRARKEARREAKHLAETKTNTRAIEAEPESAKEPVQGTTVDLFEAARAEIASSVSSAMAEDQPADAANSIQSPEDASFDMEQALTKQLAQAASEAVNGKNADATVRIPVAESTAEEAGEILIPTFTADELIRKAIMDGDEPDVVEDKNLGITLLDYSSIL